MNQEAADLMTRARAQLLIDHPFFGELALRLRLIEKPETPTMAVDGTHIFYNPGFVTGISDGLRRAVVAHEVMHCVFEHTMRRNGRDIDKWNVAGDHVINLTLTDAGFDFEGTGLMNEEFRGMTTDEIYNLLPDDTEPSELDLCMDGEAGSLEVSAVDWKIATLQAASNAKAMGKLPANMTRFIDEITTSKVDWRERLRRFVTEVTKDDYSWSRPNRRFLNQGFYLPSLYSEGMGELVVAIDTSGSIDQKTLTAFGSEIKAIVQSARPSKTTVVYCDAAVNHVDEFLPNDDLQFAMHGGGGTDFRPPFEHVAKGSPPVCLVYLTDGYGPFPKDPGYPVIWCCTTSVVAPIGETIPIEV